MLHYLFERLIATDEECRTTWEATRKVATDRARTLPRFGLFSPLTDDIKHYIEREIQTGTSRVVKLTWKYDPSLYSSSTVLYYLLEGRRPGSAQRVRGEAPLDAMPSG